ncbi:hypothetical protein BJ322DRAFT_458089 [Thelephora terrestris]|uniref:DUF6534 domain-containing protein n=1 Tax=Thelephora terrestris TaxID=56493 RepID=A0A9P6H4N0_9AGAM|nr:hypothetical protein BJ322DRAFT_458089 [Thelephora terrestris]
MMSQDLRETLGAVLVGSACAATLTGVVGVQTTHYFQNYPGDKPLVKLMVAVVWLLDLLHTMMIFAADWTWLIDHFNDLGFVSQIPWSLGVTIVLTATVTIIVHFFFAYRIYCLSRGNWLVVGPIVALAVIRLSLASASCAEMLLHPTFSEFVKKAAWVFTMGLVASSTLDVVITSCLLWYLDHARTGFMGMDQIINTLCLYTVENGLLTSVAIVTSLGCWLGMQSNLVFLAIHFVLAKLYANSLLATLNGRKRLRERKRRTQLGNGTQLMFNLPMSPTLKHSTDHMEVLQVSEEKSSMRHDEEAGIPMSPIRSQITMEKVSVETASTSKMDSVIDIR